MKYVIRFSVLPLLLLALAPLRAQDAQQAQPLEDFVRQVTRLWAAGDASALIEHIPADGRIFLDIGDVSGAVQGRHAAAALRVLFADRETTSARPTRVTIAGGRPLRGFGEIAWSSRSRGMSQPQSSVVYVGTLWENGGWRIRELRLLR
jgi:hypothetical protein